ITALNSETDPLSGNSVLYASTAGGADAFVAKWDSSGNLAYSTYLGGAADDIANAIAVDSSGNAYVAGNTSSSNFLTINAIQAAFGGGSDVVTDAFVAKLNNSANAILYSTY